MMTLRFRSLVLIHFLVCSSAFPASPVRLSERVWTRDKALELTNHPLVVQLGTGALPLGSFKRCVASRDAIIEAINEVAAEVAEGRESEANVQAFLSLLGQERQRSSGDGAAWVQAAVDSGKKVIPRTDILMKEIPEEEGVSRSASMLIRYLSGSENLVGVAAILRDLTFAHTTLAKAGLGGGDAYGGWVRLHAEHCPPLLEACDEALETLSAGWDSGDLKAFREESERARGLLFTLVDGEGREAGLTAERKDEAKTMTLLQAREEIERVEPGYMSVTKKEGQLMVEEMMFGRSVEQRTEYVSSTQKQAQSVVKVEAYMQSKRAMGEEISPEAVAKFEKAKADLFATDRGREEYDKLIEKADDMDPEEAARKASTVLKTELYVAEREAKGEAVSPDAIKRCKRAKADLFASVSARREYERLKKEAEDAADPDGSKADLIARAEARVKEKQDAGETVSPEAIARVKNLKADLISAQRGSGATMMVTEASSESAADSDAEQANRTSGELGTGEKWGAGAVVDSSQSPLPVSAEEEDPLEKAAKLRRKAKLIAKFAYMKNARETREGAFSMSPEARRGENPMEKEMKVASRLSQAALSLERAAKEDESKE